MAIRFIPNIQIVPVLDLEPPGMFDRADTQILDTEKIQSLFRRSAPLGLTQIPFVPGSEKLISLPNLLPNVGEVAQIVTHDVTTLADMEIAGGYAFLDRGVYAFGAEPGTTLEDTHVWEQSVPTITKEGRARIQYAYDALFDAELNPVNRILSLRHNRTGNIYQVEFDTYAAEISRATESLRQFALAVVPEFEKRLRVSERKRYALENFKHHPEWFGQGSNSSL